jgi:hypothetical protein
MVGKGAETTLKRDPGADRSVRCHVGIWEKTLDYSILWSPAKVESHGQCRQGFDKVLTNLY